jgi:demethylmenaquinone methyltransferase/2-methoxy-6-polyprenyl-1,4-benzoquinol methylase
MSRGNHTDAELRQYYAARAREYDRIYEKPERQADLRKLEALLPDVLAGRRVLEVACGTGYWTQFISRKADGVVAVDASTETLELAAARHLAGRVEFRVADAYDLTDALGQFDGAFAGFRWSHVPVREQTRFFESLDRRLHPGAKVVLLDNLYVEGSSTPISHRDEDGNTYQRRQLADGTEHMVLKNFPTERELNEAVQKFGHSFEYLRLEYYWVFVFEKKA